MHYHVFAIIKISKEYGLFSPSLVHSAILVFLVTGGLEPVRFAILPIGEIAFADVSKLDKIARFQKVCFGTGLIFPGQR